MSTAVKTLPGGFTATKCGNPGSRRWLLRDATGASAGYFDSMAEVRAKVAEIYYPLRERLCTPATIEQAGRLLA